MSLLKSEFCVSGRSRCGDTGTNKKKEIYKYAKEYIIIFPLKCVHKCNLCNKLFMKFRVLGVNALFLSYSFFFLLKCDKYSLFSSSPPFLRINARVDVFLFVFLFDLLFVFCSTGVIHIFPHVLLKHPNGERYHECLSSF